jgi:predicted kinase
MAKLAASVGISGSGKTTFGNKLENITVICPDDIRKELTGDISDQSRNVEVWRIAYDRLRKSLENGEDVYFSATTLTSKNLKALLDVVEYLKPEITIYAFEDSRDWKLCEKRVKEDLKNGVERSNTDIKIDNKPLIQSMSEKYINMVDNVLPRNYPELEVVKIRS